MRKYNLTLTLPNNETLKTTDPQTKKDILEVIDDEITTHFEAINSPFPFHCKIKITNV